MNKNEIYGGKGTSLLKLKELGYDVPNFFILDTTFFKKFIEYNNLRKDIENFIKDGDVIKIQNVFKNANFSDDMLNRIYTSFEELNTDVVSIRSSATQEDGKNKSFAGQFYTGLNINKENLIIEIKKCYASMFDIHIKEYINDSYDNLEMAVVIQKMIKSEFSGVAFSSDYSNIYGNFSIIEACPGLGEKLVSGEITPTKYFIRKKYNYIDQIIGENLPIENYIEKIAQIIENIEKDYKMPMDVEWAISENKIYILQARPIVGTAKLKSSFKLVLSRPKTLAYMQIEELAENEGIRNALNGLYYLKPIFYYNNNVFEEYYNFTDIEENPNLMVNYIIKMHKKELTEHTRIALSACKEAEENLEELSIEEITNLSSKIFAINNIVNFLEARIDNDFIKNDNDNKTFVESIIKYREYLDDIDYKIDEEIEKRIKKVLPSKYIKYYKVMTIKEIFGNKEIDEEELKLREEGFALFNGNIILKENLKEFFEQNNMNIILKDEEKIIDSSLIRGAIAYPGKVIGKAKIVYTIEDTEKIKEGDIIISPMTVPNFIDAVKRASAIVTDEGGTVCHAALIAREFRKTCIVGTRNATKILKDNMIIEVDGNNGVVNIINKEVNNE